MGVDTTLSRVRKSEFFAILAPGVYVVSSFFLVILVWHYAADSGPCWRRILDVFGMLSHDWPIPAAGAFFAYLFGCVVRAIPVRIADKFCGRVFRITARNPFEKILYKEEFPYPSILKEQWNTLKSNKVATHIVLPRDGDAHTMFNYWKAILCQFAPDSFAFAQELEGQVRLFAGMFWSGMGGFFASIFCVALLHGRAWSSWYNLVIVFGGISLWVGAMFGWRLRRVRGDEVRGVFLAMAGLSDGSPIRVKEQALHAGGVSD